MTIILDKCVCVFVHPILTQSKSNYSSRVYVLQVTTLPLCLRFYHYIYQLFGGCGIFSYSFYKSNQERSKTYYILNIRYSIYNEPRR